MARCECGGMREEAEQSRVLFPVTPAPLADADALFSFTSKKGDGRI